MLHLPCSKHLFLRNVLSQKWSLFSKQQLFYLLWTESVIAWTQWSPSSMWYHQGLFNTTANDPEKAGPEKKRRTKKGKCVEVLHLKMNCNIEWGRVADLSSVISDQWIDLKCRNQIHRLHVLIIQLSLQTVSTLT